MQEKEGPLRLELVEGFAHTDQDHPAVLGVLADLASRGALVSRTGRRPIE
jgi:hypothetical protein